MSFKNFSATVKTSNENSVKAENKISSASSTDKPVVQSKDKPEPANTLSKS